MPWTYKERELVAAIKAGSISDTKKALEAGADVNAINGYETVFVYVCRVEDVASKTEIIQLLLDYDADVNATGRFKCTPLMYTCANPNITPEIIQLLLDHGADVNAKDNDWWTPLMYACANRHSESEILHKIIKILVKYKADLNEINKYDRTALMYALDNDNMESKTKKLLIKRGADINPYNCWSEREVLRMEQKLNAMQREMIADMTKDITKLEAQQAWNKFQAKKIAKQRMSALKLGQYRT